MATNQKEAKKMTQREFENQLTSDGYTSRAGIWLEPRKLEAPLRKWHVHVNKATYYVRKGFQQGAEWVETKCIWLDEPKEQRGTYRTRITNS